MGNKSFVELNEEDCMNKRKEKRPRYKKTKILLINKSGTDIKNDRHSES